MKNKLVILFFLFIHISFFCQSKDSITNLNSNKIKNLQSELEYIKKNQLNYKIEKDLIRETYSRNYEVINLMISISLGIIGIFGYLGIRDINSIKKDYRSELETLKEVQNKFKLKSVEFENEKTKFNDEIKQIIVENEKQNKKIKFIELKEKALTHLKNNTLYQSLELINAALEISPEDIPVLIHKARILNRLNQTIEALKIYKELYSKNSQDTSIALDMIETMLFANDLEEAEKLILKYSIEISKRSAGKLNSFFKAFQFYHKQQDDKLLALIKKTINFSNIEVIEKHITDWDLEEAKFFISHLPDSKSKSLIQNFTWYLDGQISTKTVCKRLEIEIPQ